MKEDGQSNLLRRGVPSFAGWGSPKIQRGLNAVTTAPGWVSREVARYFVYWRIFYFLAGVTHGLSILFFLDREVWLMAWFNVGSVIVFTTCMLLLYRGWFRSAYWFALAELVSHAIAATISVGTEFGALDAILLVLVLLYVQPFYPLILSLVLSALVLAAAVFTQQYMLTHAPLYPHFHVTSGDLAMRVVTWPMLMLAMVVPFIRAASKAEKELEIAHGESERLLHNILPVTVADRLKAGEDQIADEHSRVAVMFVDIVGFTEMSRGQAPAKIVAFLNKFFVAVDDLIELHNAEKIKTIGDAIMITVGAPTHHPNPEDEAMDLARDILAAAKLLDRPDTGNPLVVRIGLHSGPAVAGVIGKAKFAYDIWGETVNIAARMESTGVPGTVQVSEDFASRLTRTFEFEERRRVTVASSDIDACIYRFE